MGIEEQGKTKMERIGNTCSHTVNIVFKVLGTLIFLFLSWYSFRYTQDISPLSQEIPSDSKDFWPLHLAALFVIFILVTVLAWLERKLNEKWKKRLLIGMLALAILVVTGEANWWITSAERPLQGDQFYVYVGAKSFLNHNYSSLTQGGYFGMYPHQLGITSLMMVIFKVFHTKDYIVWEILNVFYAAGIVFLGFLILRTLSKSFIPAMLYGFSVLFLVPLVCYTHWVYGDIPSIFFMLLAAYCFLCFYQKGGIGYLPGSVISILIACLYRKNSLIFSVALLLLYVFTGIRKRKWPALLAGFLSILLPILAYGAITHTYENISGIKLENGLPNISWIAMGLEDSPERGPGWYNSIGEVYKELNFDKDEILKISREQIKNRLAYFIKQPVYTLNFFKRKVLSQWNQPLYQSLYFATRYDSENRPDNRLLNEMTYGKLYKILLGYSNCMQSAVFLGVLLYCILGITKKSAPETHILILAIIGGFLFSVIWEAKARYILPYYIMMYPMFGIGYDKLRFVFMDLRKRKNKKEK